MQSNQQKLVQVQKFSVEGFKVTSENFDISTIVLQDEEFVAKVHAAPINPLDLQKLQGKLPNLVPPYIPGSEGSGIIMKVKAEKYQNLIGKKVSFAVLSGTYKEYVVGNFDMAVVLNDDADLNQSACAIINPLTTIGLVEKCLANGGTGIVNTASNSALGQMLYKYCQMKKIPTVNLVRTPQKVQQFKEKYPEAEILDIQDKNFEKNLKESCEKLKVNSCVDCIGGSLTGQIFNNMPQFSNLYVYGSMSGQDISGVNGLQVRWGQKSISGFVLMFWWAKLKPEEKQKFRENVRENLSNIFTSNIRKEYSFEQVQNAFEEYLIDQSSGKILIKP